MSPADAVSACLSHPFRSSVTEILPTAFLYCRRSSGWFVTFDLFLKCLIILITLLDLSDDKVPNVRLRFCSLLPHLHTSLRGLDLETEKRLIVQLDSAVRRLVETEKDRDVKEELTKFFGWIEQQEKKGPRITDEDAQDDRRKEEQENQWDLADERQQSHQTAASGESLRLPFFVSVQETHEPDANEPQPPEPAQGQ